MMIKTFFCRHCGKQMQNGQRHSCKAMKRLGMWDKKAVDGEPNFTPGPPELANDQPIKRTA